jgi:hypothetical protein
LRLRAFAGDIPIFGCGSDALDYCISKFARRAQILANRKLGFGFSSRQDAKSAKIGNIFFLKNFASLRLCEKIPRFGCGSAALGPSW